MGRNKIYGQVWKLVSFRERCIGTELRRRGRTGNTKHLIDSKGHRCRRSTCSCSCATPRCSGCITSSVTSRWRRACQKAVTSTSPRDARRTAGQEANLAGPASDDGDCSLSIHALRETVEGTVWQALRAGLAWAACSRCCGLPRSRHQLCTKTVPLAGVRKRAGRISTALESHSAACAALLTYCEIGTGTSILQVSSSQAASNIQAWASCSSAVRYVSKQTSCGIAGPDLSGSSVAGRNIAVQVARAARHNTVVANAACRTVGICRPHVPV